MESVLKPLLEEARQALGVDRAFLGFIDAEQLLRVPASLTIPHRSAYVLALSWREGLTGKAMELREILAYPEDEAAKRYYRAADGKVTAEITGAICYRGEVLGAIWLDSLAPDFTFGQEGKRKLRQVIERIQEDIALVFSEMERVEQLLQDLAKECLKGTGSDRGYIAVKRGDAGLGYFLVGEATDRFKKLSELEGLSGRVLQTGQPINCPDVTADPTYICSHESVRSEIIFPIFDSDAVIGIVSMESFAVNAYTPLRVRKMKEFAHRAAQTAHLYRLSTVQGDATLRSLADLVRGSLYAPRPDGGIKEMYDKIISLLHSAVRAHTTGTVHWWRGTIPPEWVKAGVDHRQERGIVPLSEGHCGIFRHIALSGAHVGTLGVEYTPSPTSAHALLGIIEQMCDVVAALLGHWNQEYQYREYLELQGELAARPADPFVIEQVVRGIPRVLRTRHCTLFVREEWAGCSYLVPGPTSATRLHTPSGTFPGFEWRADDGVAAWVAVTRQPLCLANVQDRASLAGIDPRLCWSARVKEDGGVSPRAFAAVPVCCPASSAVIGVLQTYRDEKGSQFSDEERTMLATLALLLAPPLCRALRQPFPGGRAGGAPAPSQPAAKRLRRSTRPATTPPSATTPGREIAAR